MVCVHDKTLNQQCMLAQARPPMINHLTSSTAEGEDEMCPEDARTSNHLPSNINFNWTQRSHR